MDLLETSGFFDLLLVNLLTVGMDYLPLAVSRMDLSNFVVKVQVMLVLNSHLLRNCLPDHHHVYWHSIADYRNEHLDLDVRLYPPADQKIYGLVHHDVDHDLLEMKAVAVLVESSGIAVADSENIDSAIVLSLSSCFAVKVSFAFDWNS